MNYLSSYVALLRLNKPIGALLTLWPCLWALWLAHRGWPPRNLLLVMLLGALLARSTGCVINDIFDRDLDRHVARTQHRPLACHSLSVKQAMATFILLGLLSFSLTLFLNLYSLLIAAIAGILTIMYPLAKRYTYFPQVLLGIVFNMGVLISFTASVNNLPWIAWLIYIAAILWTVAYDTLYAMTDRDDDKKIGIKSTAIRFGQQDRLIIGLLQAGFLLTLGIAGLLLNLTINYLLGLLCAALLLIYQQYLIKNRDGVQCFRAFLTNAWVGAVIFLGIATSIC